MGSWWAATDEGNIVFAGGRELHDLKCIQNYFILLNTYMSAESRLLKAIWNFTWKNILFIFMSFQFSLYFVWYVFAVSLAEGTVTFCDFINVIS